VVIFGHDTLNDGLNKRSNRDRILRELEANLRLAEEWNIANLVVFSGQRNGLADDVGMQVCAETLAAIAAKAESAGVTLLLELLNSKVNHPDYQCDRTAWGIEVCRMVDSPAVRLLYDIYHMQIMEGDIIQTIRDNHTWFGHYHTAGVPGRNELNDDQELNYAAIVRAIVASGLLPRYRAPSILSFGRQPLIREASIARNLAWTLLCALLFFAAFQTVTLVGPPLR